MSVVAEQPNPTPTNNDAYCRVVYSETDRSMIDYALRWVNHGGGPGADIHTRFGVNVREFYRGIIEILDRDPGSTFSVLGLSPVMVTRIKAVAQRRIWTRTDLDRRKEPPREQTPSKHQ